jgi:hypothetical protein
MSKDQNEYEPSLTLEEIRAIQLYHDLVPQLTD